jgi:hypothetical protein
MKTKLLIAVTACLTLNMCSSDARFERHQTREFKKALKEEEASWKQWEAQVKEEIASGKYRPVEPIVPLRD